jgi:hypothetical protein
MFFASKLLDLGCQNLQGPGIHGMPGKGCGAGK